MESSEADSEKENRKTPYFGNTFLQNTFSYLEDVENNSDESSIPEEGGTYEMKENKMKIAQIKLNEEPENFEDFEMEKIHITKIKS